MRQLYLSILFLYSLFSFSQNFTDTRGGLEISTSGTAVYTLPIAIPPSLNNAAPSISLTYNSSMRGGIAGQNWTINSISAISRTASRKDIDGIIDGVDFDIDDKLSLDGQRLIKKTGTYWVSGSTYETEFKSNSKVELRIEGSTTYFIVTSPNGSRSWYGSKGAGSLQNSVSASAWYIVRYEDVNGNFIDYNYKTITYNSTNQIYIDNIVFSGNTVAGITAQNKIIFNYRDAKRVERDYIKGLPVYASKILQNIEVYTNNSIFRKYVLSHTEDATMGYERLSNIKEVNAVSEESNPVVFTYTPTAVNQQRIERAYTNNLAFDKTELVGDFDGDGRLDFIADNKLFTNLFTGSSGNTPISLPAFGTTYINRIKAITTLTDNKLNQFNSVVAINELSNVTEFKVSSLSGSNLVLNYNKSIALVNSVSYPVTTCPNCEDPLTNSIKNSSNYYEGDFNGDGISEIFIEAASNEVWNVNIYGTSEWDCSCSYTVTNQGKNLYIVDMNPNASNILGTAGFVQLASSSALYDGEKFVYDFNSDGKSDILIIKPDKTYKIIGFKQLNVAPWSEIELIATGSIDKYSKSKQILFGDYNGDGKTDILLPSDEGGAGKTEWNIYYSNPKPAGGELFTKEVLNIVEYRPDSSKEPATPFDTQVHYSTYYAMDINGDGKSDLVRVWRKYYKPRWTINDHNTQWQVTAFANNIGKVSASGFTQSYDSGTFDSGSPDIPIPLAANFRYNNANTDLVLIRGHKEFIEYYQFNKNIEKENRLVSVTESSGNIKYNIDYLPMEASDGKLGVISGDFYTSANVATFPNIEIIRNSGNYLVSKLTSTINGISKYQDFRYRGFVSNFYYGPVGFTRVSRSDWYLNSSDTKVWTTQQNDVNLRGATVTTWASTLPAGVFAAIPTGLLSTNTSAFSSYTDPTSKVYTMLLNSFISQDALTGVKNENTYTYDTAINDPLFKGLETKRITKKYTNSTLQGTVTIDSQYDSNISGTGTYYVGRLKKSTTTLNNAASNDTRVSEEVYNYIGNNLTSTEKKGNNSAFAIIEDLTYDLVGNVLTKTISAPGATPVPATKKITNEYDASKRFITKKTENQTFITTLIYNTVGQITQSTDYLGVTTNFTFDNWGKLLKTVVSGMSTTPIETVVTYAKLSNGGYNKTSTSNNDIKTVIQYDVLGREVVNSKNGFATNAMTSTQTVYDGLGRKQKISEPYFSSPGLWTIFEYDHLGRTTKIKSPTDKIQTFTYVALTTTSNDDGKVSSVTVDALGNKVQTTDPGGTIYFKYFANGQQKEADFEGNKVINGIDNWGNKISVSDPNAGNYNFSYDALGTLKSETVVDKGTTTYDYDAVGRIKEKKINGVYTYSTVTYNYNSLTNLLSGTSFVDQEENATTIVNFTYDNFKRLITKVENTPYAIFSSQYTYDNLGRIDTETKTATLGGKNSSKVFKNVYKNGFHWQILDGVSGQVIWQANTFDERGKLLTATLGNAMSVTNSFDIYGYAKQIKYEKTGTSPVNILTTTTQFEPKRGNLLNRTNSMFAWNESFTYDDKDRLLTFNNKDSQLLSQSYDNKGRISTNNVGTYKYTVSGKLYQNNAITLTNEALSYYTNRSINTTGIIPSTSQSPNLFKTMGPGPPPPPSSTIGLNIKYNVFKAPVTIEEIGGDEFYLDRISYNYNADGERSVMFYGGVQDDKLNLPMRKHYSADGTMEIKENRVTGETDFIIYIGGNGYTAPAVYKSNGVTAGANLYLHRDYQGTILAITNETGAVVEKRLFDAWGLLLKVQNGTGVVLIGLDVLDRGYTGHEHLRSVALINMNGRIYDPLLHRFLQPDNFIQQSDNTQNYNRYAYVLNNPLKYTDPSGEELISFGVAVIIGVAIAATSYTLNALLADVPFSVGGLGKAVFIGALSSSVTYGVGVAANSIFTTPALSFWQGAGQGALTGAIAGIANTTVTAVLNNSNLTLNQVLGGTVIGGIAGGIVGGLKASSNGQKFYNGCREMGVNAGDPVPATDNFLNEAQKTWFPEAPMDKVKVFSTENLTQYAKDAFVSDPKIYAATFARSINGTLTGNSAVFFNPNTAFTTAKTLYFAMGHEFIHVSQYAALAGQNYSILQNPDFHDMLEFHAYSYQHNFLGDEYRGTSFGPEDIRKFAEFKEFSSMGFTNFNWTTNSNFQYPLKK